MHIYKPNCKCPKDRKEKRKCTCGAKWGFLIDVGTHPVTGKRQQKFKGGFSTRKEAELAAAAFKLELAQGTYVAEQDITFERSAEEWLEWYANSGRLKKPGTLRIRKNEIARLKRHFAKLKTREITQKKYQDALNKEHAEGASFNTLSGMHTTARMIFRHAAGSGAIKTDPSRYAYVPRGAKTVEELEAAGIAEKYMEPEELERFLHAARWSGLERDRVIFFMLAYTGIRAGELCALKWSDIDLVELTVTITKTYYNPTNNIRGYKLVPPKTESSIRTIFIDEELAAILEDHKALQEELFSKYGATVYDGNFVIAKMDGNPGYPEYIKTIENRMRRLLKRAGLPEHLTPHSLRHTHTSMLAAAGIPLHEIMARLGHKDDNTTREVYTHITKERRKAAPLKFSEILRDAAVK